MNDATVMDLIEASYTSELTDRPWMRRTMGALASLVGARSAAFFRVESSYGLDGDFRVNRIGDLEAIGPDCEWTPNTVDTVLNSPVREACFAHTQGITLSVATGLGTALANVPGWRDCWREPIADSLGLISRDARGDGFCACVGLDTAQGVTAREGRLLTKLAAHLGASDRLRRAAPSAPLDEAEVVLTPNGKVLHTRGAAEKHLDMIDDGWRRRKEASKTKHDAERALEIWRGLIAGRWSLVDHFDTDGKRFVLAMRNAPMVDRRKDLTARERRVAALAAMGSRDKEIAYMLGLTQASVTASLHRARTKLGVTSRAQLAAVWRRADE